MKSNRLRVSLTNEKRESTNVGTCKRLLGQGPTILSVLSTQEQDENQFFLQKRSVWGLSREKEAWGKNGYSTLVCTMVHTLLCVHITITGKENILRFDECSHWKLNANASLRRGYGRHVISECPDHENNNNNNSSCKVVMGGYVLSKSACIL